MKAVNLFVCILVSSLLAAQNNSQSSCTAPQASQFDFWLGHWHLTYNDTLHGTNHIEKIMNGCAIQENFYDPNTNYSGKSWSVYNKNYNQWQQTWVDDQGSYIALTGGMLGDSMVLTTAVQSVPTNISSTGKIVSRMVFHNIQPDSFDWEWESSTDGGKTWKNNWHIHYERKKDQ